MTITIQIGNSDDKLTQLEWSRYVEDVDTAIKWRTDKIYFCGGSDAAARWQNYCWVFEAGLETAIGSLKFELESIKFKYKQDSVAMTVGTTEFV